MAMPEYNNLFYHGCLPKVKKLVFQGRFPTLCIMSKLALKDKGFMIQERHYGGLQGHGVWSVPIGQAQVLLHAD